MSNDAAKNKGKRADEQTSQKPKRKFSSHTTFLKLIYNAVSLSYRFGPLCQESFVTYVLDTPISVTGCRSPPPESQAPSRGNSWFMRTRFPVIAPAVRGRHGRRRSRDTSSYFSAACVLTWIKASAAAPRTEASASEQVFSKAATALAARGPNWPSDSADIMRTY